MSTRYVPLLSLTVDESDRRPIPQGYEYSRSDNPNRRALESQLAILEGGEHGLAFASGSAATATVFNAIGSGSHVVSVNDVYGGTFRYMKRVAKENQGVDVTFLDLENLEEESILAALRPNTKVCIQLYLRLYSDTDTLRQQLIWIESPTNPTLRLIDIRHVAQIVAQHPSRPLVLVDNTFLSPYYQSPLKLGADAVLHSLTKYVNGHSDVVMGAVILKGPSENSNPHLEDFISRLRFLQNAIGAVPSPYDSWLAQRGAKTLQLRMRQHGLNGLAVARALEKAKSRGLVRDVVYPGLPSHPRFGIAYKVSLSDQAKHWVDSLRGSRPLGLALDSESDTYDPDRHGIPFGGMVSFRINGAEKETDSFLANLKFFTLAESLGGVESLVEVPEKMTHGVSAMSLSIRNCVLTICLQSIPPAERALLGIGPDLIRLSVGVEDPEDLVRDIERALEVAVKGDTALAAQSIDDDPTSIARSEYDSSRPDSEVTSENGEVSM